MRVRGTGVAPRASLGPRDLRRWTRRVLAGLGAVLLGLGLATAPALAAETGLKGVVKDPASEVGIAGVTINVAADGFTGSATTDAEGAWFVAVPSAGKYEVAIDTTTLPAGLGLADPTKAVLNVNVLSEGRVQAVLFSLAAGGGGGDAGADSEVTTPADEGSSLWSQVPQLTVDGLIFGIVIALAAVGLSLVFGTTKLTNFAHGELIALGGLSTYFFNVVVGLPLILSIVIAFLFSAVVGGWLQNRILWKPLRKRGTGLIAALVVSIGLGLFLRYLFLFLFGGQSRTFNEYAGQPGIEIGPVLITPKDLIASTVGILLIAGTIWWLLRTKDGKATRAVADNPALASASGIDVEKVISTVWVLGAALASFSGIMIGLQVGVNWQMGFGILLLVFAGSVLGGLGTAFGAILGSLIVGLLIQLSTLFVPTELKYVGALLILILILLVRPQGILGKSERVG